MRGRPTTSRLPGTSPPPPGSDTGGSLAVGEQADFDRAKAAFDAGDFQGAAGLFRSFTQTYTAGPLNGEAHFWRGEALSRLGQTADAVAILCTLAALQLIAARRRARRAA